MFEVQSLALPFPHSTYAPFGSHPTLTSFPAKLLGKSCIQPRSPSLQHPFTPQLSAIWVLFSKHHQNRSKTHPTSEPSRATAVLSLAQHLTFSPPIGSFLPGLPLPRISSLMPPSQTPFWVPGLRAPRSTLISQMLCFQDSATVSLLNSPHSLWKISPTVLA